MPRIEFQVMNRERKHYDRVFYLLENNRIIEAENIILKAYINRMEEIEKDMKRSKKHFLSMSFGR